MATDRYVRVVLTVIAACLVYLCVRDAAPPAQAQGPQQPMEVVLVGVNRDTYRNLPWQPLAVSPQQQQMDVVLVGVRNNYGARWDPLHVAGSDGKSVPVTVTNT